MAQTILCHHHWKVSILFKSLAKIYIINYYLLIDIYNRLPELFEWAINSILEFRDSFRRSGRQWVIGYGFSEQESIEHNLALYQRLTSHSNYIHLRSSPDSPYRVSGLFHTILNNNNSFIPQ